MHEPIEPMMDETRFVRALEQGTERGAVMFLVAGTVLIVLMMGALAVDLSATATRGQQMQNAVDAAALAGVRVWSETGDAAQTELVVGDVLHQNGVGNGDSTTFAIDYLSAVEINVRLDDADPDLLFGGIVGLGDNVERVASARFEHCDESCRKDVLIPAPFKSVDATGNGDGYKPIPVGDSLYALNHQSDQLQIVCISRTTEEKCWSTIGKNAYPSGYRPPYSPEMPHAAVVDTKIYWTSSLSTGTYLYCFETVTATPCSTPFQLNDRPRGSSQPREDNRGGGTVAYGGNVYTFTDDHKVHCVVPGSPMTWCSGYTGGLTDGLGAALFPTNEITVGNDGSGIDRIIDEATGRIYATLHIDFEVATGSADCSAAPLQDPVGLEVAIKNVEADEYMSVDSTNSNDDTLMLSSNTSSPYIRWQIVDAGGSNINIRSLANGRNVDADGGNSYANTASDSPPNNSDERWRLADWNGASHKIRGVDWTSYRLIEYSGDVAEVNFSNSADRWEFWPWQCVDSTYVPLPEPTLPYAKGTWVHCWDAVNAIPCAGFTPSRLHADNDTFSGRLFFYFAAGGNPEILGVCSTGFTEEFIHPADMRGKTEITCVDDGTGVVADSYETAMAPFLGALDSYSYKNGSSWGTWGDPHYNEEENRLFYPTHRVRSRVLCWDFDYGWCGQREGVSTVHGTIQDYGYFSEGNCVYGLGHNAVFWAFHAEDINNDCTGSGTTTVITPCNCSGSLYWGTLVFDVDIALFDSFLIEIFDTSGSRVYPPDDPDLPPHSLHEDGSPYSGDTIDLNHLPVAGASDQLIVEVRVEAENDPWAISEQTFSIMFVRAPVLTE